ncbi:hypothetical protein ACGFX4_01525 [Kitasatospora sp. NPDC048365]|uniref:hypothetical protein n=1 Tax=Kitasatospora sp. NPDC048365 TaxID=3364050 RepID=UPI003713232A
MPPVRPTVAALALLAALGLSACGSTAEPPKVASAGGASATATADSAEQARKLTDCLRGEGVVLTHGTDGQPVIDKEKNPVDRIARATEKCRQYQPAAAAPSKLSAQDLEARRRYSACMREHGLAYYPDPDPATGEPALTDELAARLKTDPARASAAEACRSVQPYALESGVPGA